MDQQSSYQFILSILLAAIQSCKGDPLEPNGTITALLQVAIEVFREAGWSDSGLENYMHEAVKGIARDDSA